MRSFWLTKSLKIFVALSRQVLLLVWCKKLKKFVRMFTFVQIAALIKSISRFQFYLQQISYFGFERLLHSFSHKGVSSFLTLIVTIDDDTELRMQKCCNYILIVGKHTLNLSLEWTVTLYFKVKNLLALIQRERKRVSLIFYGWVIKNWKYRILF